MGATRCPRPLLNTNENGLAFIQPLGLQIHGGPHQPVLIEKDFSSCPQLNVIILPGGVGSFAEAKNAKLLEFLKTQAATAMWVTSVCTGSSILAEAGLLEGRKATSNKAYFNIQAKYGQNVDWIHEARFVVDGKFITASGVSAGLDMAFVLGEKLFPSNIVSTVANQIHYRPLSNGDDPFARIYPRDDGWFPTLASAAYSFLSPIIIPMEVNQTSTPSNKKSILSIILFKYFDTLDLAGVLESFMALRTTHQFELVAVNPYKLTPGEGRPVQCGGDSMATVESLAGVVDVVCDRVVDEATLVQDVFDTVVWQGRDRIVYIPSVNSKFGVDLEEDVAACKVFDALNFLEACSAGNVGGAGGGNQGGSYIFGSGDVVRKAFAKKCGGGEKIQVGQRGWGRLGRVVVAETGLSGVIAALEIVKEVSGEKAVVQVAKMMEISGDLMPEGVVIY
ncbi:class I glutamine amidotransferase-like protein [Obelidium mucronatum]|nr:class I glutamine amidotransferase-like protein [Obelidium mucronatum]